MLLPFSQGGSLSPPTPFALWSLVCSHCCCPDGPSHHSSVTRHPDPRCSPSGERYTLPSLPSPPPPRPLSSTCVVQMRHCTGILLLGILRKQTRITLIPQLLHVNKKYWNWRERALIVKINRELVLRWECRSGLVSGFSSAPDAQACANLHGASSDSYVPMRASLELALGGGQ